MKNTFKDSLEKKYQFDIRCLFGHKWSDAFDVVRNEPFYDICEDGDVWFFETKGHEARCIICNKIKILS